jgi:hypothetical protein
MVYPWYTHFAEKIAFYPDLIVECSKKDSSDELRRYATELTLASHEPHDMEVWSDGSVKDSFGAGAAILFFSNKRKSPIVSGKPSGEISDSFRAELKGICAGLESVSSLQEVYLSNKKLLLCTDSQSSIKALMTGPLTQNTALPSYI